MIKRVLHETIRSAFALQKVVAIFGPRQVGKTTLLNQLFDRYHPDVFWINGDRFDSRALFDDNSFNNLLSILSGKKYLIIDEAQRIDNIGLKLKIIYDETKVQIVVAGSTSFDLVNRVSEPMTGRKFQYFLYPFSFEELTNHFGTFEEIGMLNSRLVFGAYPDVVNQPAHQKEILENLASGYLYKDILEWDLVRNSSKLLKLLKVLAYQTGHQVSYQELGQLIQVSGPTVENYIDLLEKTFVIFTLRSFSRNHKNELKKSKKIFFYDNGIRNTLINNFNPIELRDDTGALWENYILSERIKYTGYHGIYVNRYFWRTKYGQEINYIEERDGKLYAYEFKWHTRKKTKIPNAFKQSYPGAEYRVITPDNYYEFITTGL
jgi:predicted AAA+ superfamily ATPase